MAERKIVGPDLPRRSETKNEECLDPRVPEFARAARRHDETRSDLIFSAEADKAERLALVV